MKRRRLAGRFGLLLFVALVAQHRFAAQADLVALDRQHLYQHLVAFLQFVADGANALLPRSR